MPTGVPRHWVGLQHHSVPSGGRLASGAASARTSRSPAVGRCAQAVGPPSGTGRAARPVLLSVAACQRRTQPGGVLPASRTLRKTASREFGGHFVHLQLP